MTLLTNRDIIFSTRARKERFTLFNSDDDEYVLPKISSKSDCMGLRLIDRLQIVSFTMIANQLAFDTCLIFCI